MRFRVGCLLALAFCAVPLGAFDAPQPVEAAFKNIQVLKGVPSAQLLPIMHFMRASLGVRCDFCHVTENDAYHRDDKKEKLRARDMIVLTRRLNELGFGGRNSVTCMTCHRGVVAPVSTPETGTTFLNTTRREPGEVDAPALPTVAAVFERFEAATHIDSLGAARVRFEGCRAKIVNERTPAARAIARADCAMREELIDGDRAVVTSSLPNGEPMRAGSDGRRAWTMTRSSGVRWVPEPDFAEVERKIHPFRAALVRPEEFSSSEVAGVEPLAGEQTVAITVIGKDGIAQKLWFSSGSGLLLRRTYYYPIALGLDPEQYDFSAYKRFGAVVLPAHIKTSYLDDQHLGFSKTIVEVEAASVKPDDFDPPAQWPN
jgi:hypothetical protein